MPKLARLSEKAQGYFKAEIALNNSVEAHVALAQAYFFNKQRAESERELERASSLDPNGTWGNRARISLAKMHQLAASSGAHTSAKTKAEAMQEQEYAKSQQSTGIHYARLTNGKIFNPCVSSHLREYDIDQLLRLQNERADQRETSRENWKKAMYDYTVDRNQFEENSPEWLDRQQRINDSRKSIEADAMEIDDKFVKDCLDVNNDADKEYEIAMAAKANSAKAKGKNGGHGATDNHIADLIAQENNKRYKALRAELDDKIAALKEDGQRVKNELESSLSKVSEGAETDEAVASMNADLMERWAKIDAQVRLKVLDLRKQYEARLEALAQVTSDLNTQEGRHRDDDAELIPIGSTNMYARSYGTFGDSSGNPIPVIAEPQALRVPKAPIH